MKYITRLPAAGRFPVVASGGGASTVSASLVAGSTGTGGGFGLFTRLCRISFSFFQFLVTNGLMREAATETKAWSVHDGLFWSATR